MERGQAVAYLSEVCTDLFSDCGHQIHCPDSSQCLIVILVRVCTSRYQLPFVLSMIPSLFSKFSYVCILSSELVKPLVLVCDVCSVTFRDEPFYLCSHPLWVILPFGEGDQREKVL